MTFHQILKKIYDNPNILGSFPLLTKKNGGGIPVWIAPLDDRQTRVAFASGAQRYFGLLSARGPRWTMAVRWA
jgi:hypothetical protein